MDYVLAFEHFVFCAQLWGILNFYPDFRLFEFDTVIDFTLELDFYSNSAHFCMAISFFLLEVQLPID